MCRSKQSEAQAELTSLAQKMEAAHKAGAYPKSRKELPDFQPKERFYSFKIVQVSEQGFVAEAHGKETMAGDVWRISESSKPKQVKTAPGCI